MEGAGAVTSWRCLRTACGPYCHGVVDREILGYRFDSVTSELCSHLNDCGTLCPMSSSCFPTPQWPGNALAVTGPAAAPASSAWHQCHFGSRGCCLIPAIPGAASRASPTSRLEPCCPQALFPLSWAVSQQSRRELGHVGAFTAPQKGDPPKFVPSSWQAEATRGIKAAVQQHPCVCPVSALPWGQVLGPGLCPSPTALTGQGSMHPLFHVAQLGAASPPSRPSLCCPRQVPGTERGFPSGAAAGAVPGIPRVTGAGQSWHRRWLGAGTGPARPAVSPMSWPCLRGSVWRPGPCPPLGLPAAAGCARRVPRRPGAPPAAAPGAGAPGPPAAPAPGAAGPGAPAGCPGRCGTALAQLAAVSPALGAHLQQVLPAGPHLPAVIPQQRLQLPLGRLPLPQRRLQAQPQRGHLPLPALRVPLLGTGTRSGQLRGVPAPSGCARESSARGGEAGARSALPVPTSPLCSGAGRALAPSSLWSCRQC